MKSFLHLPLDFVQNLVHILTDTYTIFLKNGKLMALITLLIISFHSILDISNYFFSIKPLISEYLVVELFFPGTPEFFKLISDDYQDVKVLLGAELIFILISSAASFFFAIATTYAAAMTLSGKKLSIKALASTTVKLWRRPLVTYFYITLLTCGYVFLCCFLILITLLLIFGVITSKALVMTLAVPFVIIYAYIAVVWELSFVASVLEEKSGIEALGKAANIVRGMQVPGFALNLGMVILSLVLSQSYELVGKQKAEVQIIVGVVVTHSISLVIRMFMYMAYTVMYLQCKKNYREEDDLSVDINKRK